MLRKLCPLFWEQKILSVASWHQRIFTFLLLEEGKAGGGEGRAGAGQHWRMKSSRCRSALPGATRAREKPRKNLYHGVFGAEVIAALPLSSLLPSPLLGAPSSGFPQENLPCPRALLPWWDCFGDSHSGDTAPSAQLLVKAGPPRLPRFTAEHGAHAKSFFSKSLSRKLTFGSSKDPSILQKHSHMAIQHSREDLCSLAAPWRSMSPSSAISFPATGA